MSRLPRGAVAIAAAASLTSPLPASAESPNVSAMIEEARERARQRALTELLLDLPAVPEPEFPEVAVQMASLASANRAETVRVVVRTVRGHQSHQFAPEIERWRTLVSEWFRPGDVHWALHTIECETAGTGDPTITNYAGSGASGLFQHLPRYWEARSAKAGFAGVDIFNPTANVAVAAWLFYEGGGRGHWPNCGR